MKVFRYLKILGKSILQQIFLIPAAAIYYKVRLKETGVYNLIICEHIGDFIYAMGYLRAFQKEKQIKKLRVVSTAKFQGLAKLYAQDAYFAISKRWLHILCIANRYVLGQELFAGWKDNCVVEPANGFTKGYEFAKQFPQLNLKDCIRYGVFGLSEKSAFERPSVQDGCAEPGGTPDTCESWQPQADTCAGKVLLCPFAQALSYQSTDPLFAGLAARLKAQHYQVYVNAPEKQQIGIDAAPISCGLEELYQKFGQYEAVIGIRSGVLDLAALSGCRVIALYPPAGGMEVFYDIRHAGEDGVCQYQLTGSVRQDIEAVMAVMQSKRGRINHGSPLHHGTGRRERNAHGGIDAQ